jgi:hypothetical protein
MARVILSRNLQALIQPQLLPHLDRVAEDLAVGARAYARSVAYGPGTGGHYADKIEATTDMVRGRARGYVIATKFTSRFLEGGTRHMPARHVLERYGRQSGYRFRKARSR